jgi:lipoprotein-anchoring transpeptidase ErfK/SrfK
VGRKDAYPDSRCPSESGRVRQPGLRNWLSDPAFYRIHGTFEPWTIGTNVSSGCIRMINQDVIDLYGRAPVGAKVVVLPARS